MPTRSATLSYLLLVPWAGFAAAGAYLLTREGELVFRHLEQPATPSVVVAPVAPVASVAPRVVAEPLHLLTPSAGEIIPMKSGNEAEVLFRWEGGATESENGSTLSLELSPGSSFPANGTVHFTVPGSARRVVTKLQPNRYFWRLRSGADIVSATNDFWILVPAQPHRNSASQNIGPRNLVPPTSKVLVAPPGGGSIAPPRSRVIVK